MKRFPRISGGSFTKNVSLCRRSPSGFHQTIPKVSFSLKSSNSLVDLTSKPVSLSTVKNPWVEQKDPNGSGLTYFWNTETNETTPLGSTKPKHWVEVKDPNGSELTYWWDPEAHETTALGAPKPSHLATTTTTSGAVYQRPFGVQNNEPPQTLGGSMKTMFYWGIGMTFAFAAVRAVIG